MGAPGQHQMKPMPLNWKLTKETPHVGEMQHLHVKRACRDSLSCHSASEGQHRWPPRSHRSQPSSRAASMPFQSKWVIGVSWPYQLLLPPRDCTTGGHGER